MAHVASLPNVITIREGQSLGLALNLIGMTNHSVSYSYWTSLGGTADAADIGSTSGSGSMWIMSTYPYNERVPFTLSALRDGVQEQTETAYLVVQLDGNMYFPNGSSYQMVEIRILDDNMTTGSAANDVLRGTLAAENLVGQGGNDHYYVTAGDRVSEAAGGGTDTVFSAGNWTLAGNVEHLVLTGTAGTTGIGNGLANRIGGNSGNNVLNGLAGADTMTGGAGNDTYVFDEAGDRAVERVGGGIDTVRSSVSVALGIQIENLVLTGAGAIDGTGNALANVIVGNAGANLLDGGLAGDRLAGGAGNDTLQGGGGADDLSGGLGADIFVFRAVAESRAVPGGRDLIRDFSHAAGDRIDLSRVDADTTRAGDQGFALIGEGAFSGTAGELRFQRSSSLTVVSGDVDGDTLADFSFTLTGSQALVAADFLL